MIDAKSNRKTTSTVPVGKLVDQKNLRSEFERKHSEVSVRTDPPTVDKVPDQEPKAEKNDSIDLPGKAGKLEQYYALALDPIHVGTGGYRLGRVDNSIIREPGTNLPKIPGSSISGVARAYTAIQKNRYPGCAGKGGEEGNKHCCQPDCPVCTTYGFSNSKTKSSFQGLAQFFDARILFFPVHSMIGPVWVTSPFVLKDILQDKYKDSDLDGKFSQPGNGKFRHFIDTGIARQDKDKSQPQRLNLGWLLLTHDGNINTRLSDEFSKIQKEILQRVVLISDGLFSRVVNDNLEVRTSVAIDPNTGAAEDKALYTYEAIPRATVLWFDVFYNKPELFSIDKDNKPINQNWTWVRKNVEDGFDLMRLLGVGGMNTRGMGRLDVLNLKAQGGANGHKS